MSAYNGSYTMGMWMKLHINISTAPGGGLGHRTSYGFHCGGFIPREMVVGSPQRMVIKRNIYTDDFAFYKPGNTFWQKRLSTSAELSESYTKVDSEVHEGGLYHRLLVATARNLAAGMESVSSCIRCKLIYE